MLDYKGKLVLAPMVRVSELPLRKLALHYGADLVWGPEIVDKRLIASERVWNEKLQTYDYVNLKNHTNLTWRMSPSLENHRVVFQLGSSDPELAVQAAKVVAPDVAAIDLNCGCPKHFSVHSGMGSQLLRTPDNLAAILTRLVEEIGRPFDLPISAKIRVLPDEQETYALVKRIVATGIAHLTVHCRTPAMRPVEPANYDYLRTIVDICHDAGITCYVNGDVRDRAHMQELCEQYGVDGAMLARAAQFNPSSFTGGEQDMVPILEVCRGFLDACIAYDFNAAHAKYNLMNFVSGRSPLYAKFAQSKTLERLNEHLTEMENDLESEHQGLEKATRMRSVEAKANDSVEDSVKDSVKDSVEALVQSPGDSVEPSTDDSQETPVKDSVKNSVEAPVQASGDSVEMPKENGSKASTASVTNKHTKAPKRQAESCVPPAKRAAVH